MKSQISQKTGSFPVLPEERRTVLVLNEDNYDRLKHEPADAHLLFKDEFHVLELPLPKNQDIPTALRNIQDGGLARQGMMLIQSPFDTDIYEHATEACQAFATAKHLYFSRLCNLLGAKEVEVDQVEVTTRTRKSKFSAGVGKPGVANAEIAINEERTNTFKRQIHLHDTFSGGRADIEAAEDFLRKQNLWADQNMRELINQLRSSSNKMKSRRLVLNLSSEGLKNFRVFSELKVPPYIELAAEYSRVAREIDEYTVTVTVRFG